MEIIDCEEFKDIIYAVKRCSNKSVSPSVSECSLLKSSSFWMWFGLSHRNKNYLMYVSP